MGGAHPESCQRDGHLPGNEKEAGQRRKQQCGAPSRCRGESKTKTQSKEQRERKGQRSRCRGRSPSPALILGEKGAEKAHPFSSGDDRLDNPTIRVPGARASKYVGQLFGHALLRHLVRSCSGLGCFARSLFGRFDLHTGHTEAATGSLPMPLPYPEVLRGGNHGESIELARKKLINCIVIVLNYLHLGRPVSWPAECRLGQRLRKAQWESVRRFEGFLEDWLICDSIGPEEMGRTAQKVESIEDTLLARRDGEEVAH